MENDAILSVQPFQGLEVAELRWDGTREIIREDRPESVNEDIEHTTIFRVTSVR